MKVNRLNIIKTITNLVRNPEIYKFAIVGVCSALSTLSLTILFTSGLGIFYVISVAVAQEITLIWSFFVHENWTFAKIPKITNIKIRFIKYNTLALIGVGVNEAVLILLTSQVKLHYTISEVIAIFVAFFFNYLVHKKISWKS